MKRFRRMILAVLAWIATAGPTASATSRMMDLRIVEGKVMEVNFSLLKVAKEEIFNFLSSKNFNVKDVLLLTLDEYHLYLQPKGKPFLTADLGGKND